MLGDRFLRKLETAEMFNHAERQATLALCSDVRHVSRRRDIVADGAVPSHVHVVLDGWAARYNILRDGSRRITALLLPGDICDMDSAMGSAMDHGISTITNCAVAYIPGDRMDAFTFCTPKIARALRRSALVDASILRQWLVNAGRRTAVETMAHLLAELYVRVEAIGGVADGSFDLPLTQEELGDATGMTHVHVNRTLRELRERGLIKITKGRLHIPDVTALEKTAGMDSGYLRLHRPTAAKPLASPLRDDVAVSTTVHRHPIPELLEATAWA